MNEFDIDRLLTSVDDFTDDEAPFEEELLAQLLVDLQTPRVTDYSSAADGQVLEIDLSSGRSRFDSPRGAWWVLVAAAAALVAVVLLYRPGGDLAPIAPPTTATTVAPRLAPITVEEACAAFLAEAQPLAETADVMADDLEVAAVALDVWLEGFDLLVTDIDRLSPEPLDGAEVAGIRGLVNQARLTARAGDDRSELLDQASLAWRNVTTGELASCREGR